MTVWYLLEMHQINSMKDLWVFVYTKTCIFLDCVSFNLLTKQSFCVTITSRNRKHFYLFFCILKGIMCHALLILEPKSFFFLKNAIHVLKDHSVPYLYDSTLLLHFAPSSFPQILNNFWKIKLKIINFQIDIILLLNCSRINRIVIYTVI